VSFSSDGKRIVTGSYDNSARVWDVREGTPLIELNGHTKGVHCVAFSPDGMRIVTGSLDSTARVWDAWTGKLLLELRGHTSGVMSVSFSQDGKRIVTGSMDRTAKVWDIRTGTPLLELKGHTSVLKSVLFTSDGTRIITGGGQFRAAGRQSDNPGEVKVWDTRTGSLDHSDKTWDADEISNRLILSRPNYWRYQEGYYSAKKANDYFAALFYLDRILSMPMHRTTALLKERNSFQADPKAIARTSFHHPALAKTPYDSGIIQLLAIKGDRLAMRLVAQQFLREGEPGLAIPLLIACILSRPALDPPAPPVEELLLSQAYLALKQTDESKRYYRVAAEWLDRSSLPIRAANIVSLCPMTPWASLMATVAPVDDLRRNPFDWESWHECDVFRAELEKGLVVR
jgi:hypothetical protein